MNRVERVDRLQFYDDGGLDHEIGTQAGVKLDTVIEHGKWSLPDKLKPGLLELVSKAGFVD